MSQAEDISLFTRITIYLSLTMLFIIGHLRDLSRKRPKNQEGYSAVRQDYEDFYVRRLYNRIHLCWNRPICGPPNNQIQILERENTDSKGGCKFTGKIINAINLGSYNYLGFGYTDEYCTPKVFEAIDKFGWTSSSSAAELGTTVVHRKLEKLLAQFLSQEDSVVYGMGFMCNGGVLPVLAGKGDLIISDALNHASIVFGVRASGAKVKIFEHNNPIHLEYVVRTAIAEGQPRTHRPWKRVLIVVEGIYSMEGDICALKEIVEVKKKYKTYLFLDEAHSIGAVGNTGRGVKEHTGVDSKDIDIYMGTFSKSFGACGGYVAGNRQLINYIRLAGPVHLHGQQLSTPACCQVLSALEVIMGMDGTQRGIQKINQLQSNSNYMRERLVDMGLSVLGDKYSPVMPIQIRQAGKLREFSDICLQFGLAVTVVGFPATSIDGTRCRVCISASHTQQDLDHILNVFDRIADVILIRFHKKKREEYQKA